MKNVQQPAQPRKYVRGDHFQNLVEYMEDNEPENKYSDILKKIQNGDI